MSTRYLIAAAFLFGSACGAQADVLPATTSTAQSGFLSSWTTGNGTDVASTGVVGNGAVLVGGGDASVAQALYQKASANVGATSGKINLSIAEGVSGKFVVQTGNKMLAALLSDGAQVVTTADGVEVSKGQQSTDTVGGGSAPAASFPVAGGSSPAVGGAPATQLPQEVNPVAGGNAGVGGSVGAGLPSAGPAAVNGEVPEPSSIALMMAGMMGALALTRRRAR